MNKISVAIPSYKPDEKLLSTLKSIIDSGADDLIVVDDGGGAEYAEYFACAEKLPHVTVLHHEVNRGKGAALKTAFTYFLENRKDRVGIVTADADGQHLAEDIKKVGERMVCENKVIIGCRDFSLDSVPPRSLMGNRITSSVLSLFFGMKLSDTQTGLRAFPTAYLPAIMKADGDRYEYETHMLFLMKREKIPYAEERISTVYLDNNSSSHFRVIRDSARIYSLLLRYALGSIICTSAWIGLFVFFVSLFDTVEQGFCRGILAALSASVPIVLLDSIYDEIIVFKTGLKLKNTGLYIGYALLRYLPTSIAAGLLFGLTSSAVLTAVIKTALELILFPLGFRVLHNVVSRKRI